MGNERGGPLTPESGAGNGIRTRDPQLGKLILYQLSYARSSPERPGQFNRRNSNQLGV